MYECPACGYYKLDAPIAEPCPVCKGLGNQNAPCECPHYRLPDGTLTNIRCQDSIKCHLEEHRKVAEYELAKHATV